MISTLVLSSILAASPLGAPTWMPVGPTGGDVRALALDTRTPGRVYLGTPDGILYRSNDHGRHWQRMHPGFPRRGCSLDEILVDEHGVVFVGFHEVHGGGGGIARSTDGGVTFTVLKPMSGESVRALALAPANHRWMAAGTLTGVFLSRDGGEHWDRITPEGHRDLRTIESLAFDPADAQVLYAGTRHLAWKTVDGGAAWHPIHKGMMEDSHVMTLNLDPRFRRNLYATACTGIYHSTDGGSQWTKLEGIPDSSRRTRAFRQSPDHPDVLFAGTTKGLWISENRGGSWRLATEPELVINALALLPDGGILIGTEGEGVLRSGDRGRTWSASNEGFTERFVSKLLFDRTRGRVLAAVWGGIPRGGVFTASDVRGPWEKLGEGLGGRQVLSMALHEGGVLAGTDEGIFALMPDRAVWTRLETKIAGREVRARVTELLALEKNRLLAASPQGLMQSGDGGRTWTWASLGGGEITALAASPAERDVLVAATRAGFFRSEDGGGTWASVAGGLQGVVPHALAFLPTEPQAMLATTSAGLFVSRDRGASWRPMTGGIPHSDLTGLAVHPDGRTIFASDFTRGGIFRSVDGGATWERMTTEGLASDRVWMLGLDPNAPQRLLAASPGGGLHLIALSSAAADSAATARGGLQRATD